MPTLPAGLPPIVPTTFTERLVRAQDAALSAGGETLTAAEVQHALDGLTGATSEVKKAAAAWLLEHSAEFEHFTLESRDARETLKAFVASCGDGATVPATTSSPLDTRIANASRAGLTDDVRQAIADGAALAASRAEIDFHLRLAPPSSHEYFLPPVSMKLDLGDGERSYKVYLSRIVGIDLDTRRVDDPGAAERFILGDGAGRTSGVVRLLRPADVTVPGAGTAQPGPDLPHLGANLPSRVTAAIDDGLSRAYHRDGDDWRRANGRPSEREHFHPGYPLEVRDPSTDERINVVAYLSKQPNPSFAAPPNRPEEARLVTLYDETNGRAFSFIGISMPSGVTLPG